jgi:hypothetical protein
MEQEHTALDSFSPFLSAKRSMMMGIGTYQKAHHGGFVFVLFVACLVCCFVGFRLICKNDDPSVTRGQGLFFATRE